MALTAAEMDIRFGVTGADTANAAMRSLGSGFDALGNKSKQAGGFMRDAFAFATGQAIASGVRAVTDGVKSMATEVISFGSGMANVNSIMHLSGAGLQQLTDQVLSLANNPAILDGPASLADGLYNIASSGFAGADGLKVLESAAIAASAGMTTTEVAAQGITAVLNAYGMAADQAGMVSDIMFQTVNDGVITFEQLAMNMGNTLPAANSLGVSFEELGAAYAQMTLKGVAASAAETQIASIMKSSMNPTAALTAAINAQGYATAKAAIDAVGFAGYLAIISDAAGGNEAALYDMLGTQEAVNAALILGANGASAYSDEVDRMANAHGAAQAAVEEQMKSARYQIALAKKEIMLLGTEILIGFEPMVAGVARRVANFAGDLVNATKYVKSFLEPATYVNVGKFGHSVTETEILLQRLPESFRGAAMGAAVVTRATIDMAKGFVNAFQTGQRVEDLVKVLPNSIQGFATAAFTLADDFGDIIRQIRQGDWSGLFEELKDTGGHVFNIAANIVATVGETLWDWGGKVVSWIDWGWIEHQLGVGASAAGHAIKVGANFIVEASTSEGSNSAVEGITAGIVSAISASTDFATEIGAAIWDKLTAFDWLSVPTTSFGSGEGVGAAVREWIISGIKGLGDLSADDVANVFKVITGGMLAGMLAVPAATAALSITVGSFIAGAVKGLIFGDGDVDIDFDGIWSWLVEGITKAASGAQDAMSGLTDSFVSAIGGALDAVASELIAQIPHWMVLMAQGDYMGGVRELFGDSGAGTVTPYTPKPEDLIPKDLLHPITLPPLPGGGSGSGASTGGGGGAAWGDMGGGLGMPLADFSKLDTSGIDIASGALADAGQAAQDAIAQMTDSQAALQSLSDAFKRAHQPINLFASVMSDSMNHAVAAASMGAAAVDQALAWLAGALFGRGANASHAFALGLWSGVGEAEAAANAMAAAADRAVAARLAIHSPSRVMAEHAEMAVRGFVGGLQSGAGDVSRAYGATFAPETRAYQPAAASGNKVTIISVHSSEIEKIAEMARAGHEFAGGFPNEFDMLRAG